MCRRLQPRRNNRYIVAEGGAQVSSSRLLIYLSLFMSNSARSRLRNGEKCTTS